MNLRSVEVKRNWNTNNTTFLPVGAAENINSQASDQFSAEVMPSEKYLKEQTKFILSYASSMIGWYFVVWVYPVFYCILHREYIDIVGCTAMSKRQK